MPLCCCYHCFVFSSRNCSFRGHLSQIRWPLRSFIVHFTLICGIDAKYCDLFTEYRLVQSRTESRQFFPKTAEKDDDDLVVIYNRVPKTGSTSFVGVAYDLCKKNHFKVLHINITANMHVMSLNNQYKFAQNVTQWHEVKPALYHGHMAFLNFERWVLFHFSVSNLKVNRACFII